MTLPHPRLTTRLTARLTARLAGVLTLATAATMMPTVAQAAPWPGHPDRSIVRHAVRPGETATGLAVRYHAWTAELLRLNHLGTHGTVYQGQVLRVPIVVSAWRKANGLTAPQARPHHVRKKHPKKHRAHHAHRAKPLLRHSVTPTSKKWLHADLSRNQVRHLVSRMARVYQVPRTLALAIAWQESGWQQRRVSHAGALGVMQVMPDTGRWMRWYAGRPLRLRDTHDNVQAGMLTLRVLRSWTRRDNNAIAAYYQGLGAVREHGYFPDTKRYVRSVRAHQRRIIRTGSPI